MFEVISYDTYRNTSLLNEIKLLKPGMKVLIKISNGFDLANVLVRCFENNIISIPVDPKISETKLLKIINHSHPDAIISEDNIRIITTEHKNFYEKQCHKNLAFILYTSGSTGNPKGVMLSKESVIYNAQSVAKIHDFENGVFNGTCLHMFDCYAIMMSLLGSYISQSKLYIQSDRYMDDYLINLNECGATTASIVPALADKLIHHGRQEWPKKLKYLITASHGLKQKLAEEFFSIYGNKLIQGYGLTEAVNFSFIMPQLSNEDFIREYINNKPPIGYPVGDTEYKIIDNELCIKGSNTMLGYYENKEETERVLVKGWLKTGDLAYIRNGYVILDGRKKELINRGGESICPVELEEELVHLGLPKDIIVFTNTNNHLGEDISISINQSINLDYLFAILVEKKFRYSSISFFDGQYTPTHKPMRIQMGNLYLSMVGEDKYNELLCYAKKAANKILNQPLDQGASSAFILKHAKIIDACHNIPEAKTTKKSAAHDLIDLIVENWNEIASPLFSGERLISENRGLWLKLMTTWPMNEYAEFMSRFLKHKGLLNGRILEFGAGVGNTSKLIVNDINGEYIRTDICSKLLNKYKYSKHQEVYDFEKKCRWKDLDLIFGVNALHCAKDKEKAVINLYDGLKKNGYLVISEGQPYSNAQTPWALNYVFGLFKGWYDIGGFLDRKDWLHIFKKAGFSSYGACMLRVGNHDLGGIVWGKK